MATKILFLGTGELTRDPRVRRAVEHATDLGLTSLGVCARGEPPLPVDEFVVERYGSSFEAQRFPGRAGNRHRRLVREVRGVLRLARWLTRTINIVRASSVFPDVDVVHANDLDTLPAGALIARRRGARLVYDSHEVALDQDTSTPTTYRLVAAPLERALARRADAVVTVSEPIALVLQRRLELSRLPGVVLNAPAVTAAAAGTSSTPVRAVYQGGTGPGRRVEDLLDAAEQLDETVQLTIRVSGIDTDALRKQVADRGLEGRVDVVEPVPPDRMVEGLNGFNVGLIINRPASTNDRLVFPNKLFEYMMAGLAVVAPALPGLAPTIEREQIGITFAPGDATALAGALERLASDPAGLAEMRRRAREAAVATYNSTAQRPALATAWGIG